MAQVVFGLQVPMLGDWLSYGLVIAALLFACLGIGFVISLAAQTESQAIQYVMIVLLARVFFSGFSLSLRLLWDGVRVVSWVCPPLPELSCCEAARPILFCSAVWQRWV